MKRPSVRLLLAAIVAVFALGSYAEAAPRKVHHRVRHSSRVLANMAPSAKKKVRAVRKHHRTAATNAHVARPRRQSTKPR